MKNISLTVSQPCSEKWENFTSASKGRFCGSCNKVVVDFSTMNDDEIVDFFRNKPAHTCGRFRADQLKTYSVSPVVKIYPGLTLLKAGLLSLLLALVSKSGFAQTATPITQVEVVEHPGHPEEKSADQEKERTLRGLVVSGEDGMAMPGVNVILKGSTIGTFTDVDGRFEFPQKVKEGDVIMFYFIGFETMQYIVPKTSKEIIEITMAGRYELLMGAVAVDVVYQEEPSAFRKLWWKVRNLF